MAWDRSSGQSDQHRMGVSIDDLLIGIGLSMMSFVDDQQLCWRQRQGVRAQCAHAERLYRRNLDRLERTPSKSALNNSVPDLAVEQLAASVRDDLAPMRNE